MEFVILRCRILSFANINFQILKSQTKGKAGKNRVAGMRRYSQDLGDSLLGNGSPPLSKEDSANGKDEKTDLMGNQGASLQSNLSMPREIGKEIASCVTGEVSPTDLTNFVLTYARSLRDTGMPTAQVDLFADGLVKFAGLLNASHVSKEQQKRDFDNLFSEIKIASRDLDLISQRRYYESNNLNKIANLEKKLILLDKKVETGDAKLLTVLERYKHYAIVFAGSLILSIAGFLISRLPWDKWYPKLKKTE